MADPLAYFLTWTTYGTWLHGDKRGSVDAWNNQFGTEYLPSHRSRKELEQMRMKEPPLRMSQDERRIVEQAIREHCQHRNWAIIELNCRSNHVHIIVTASDVSASQAMMGLKAFATRALKRTTTRTRFWTEDGSKRKLFTQDAVNRAVQYVRDQEGKRRCV